MSDFNFFVPVTIIVIAIAIIKTEIAPPVAASIILRMERVTFSAPKVVSMVDSSVINETQADARLIAFDAENTGLLYLRYLKILMIAKVRDVNVYAAMAIVVIS